MGGLEEGRTQTNAKLVPQEILSPSTNSRKLSKKSIFSWRLPARDDSGTSGVVVQQLDFMRDEIRREVGVAEHYADGQMPENPLERDDVAALGDGVVGECRPEIVKSVTCRDRQVD